MRGRFRHRLGFTIVEAAVSVAIVGVLLVASTGAFSQIARERQIQTERREAYLLAQQLMTEITQQYFQAPGTGTAFGPQAGQTRSTFNGVDQYNGYMASPPTSQSGAVLSDYTGWGESVSVACVNPSSPTTIVAASTLKQVTVVVTSPSGKPYTLVGLRSQYGAYEAIPSSQINYIPGAAVTLQGAFPARTIYTGARPLNITTSQ